MENWKFLLQKKGARFWQEIKTQSVEIEENKYRLLGQSNYFHFPVEICLNYQANSSDRVSSYSLKHYRKTNELGLIEIFPFFDFAPGIWKLSCRADIFSEMVGEFWQENLQLKVLQAREAKLLKTAKPIDLFSPHRVQIKEQKLINLVGQILPPKICDCPLTSRAIELPYIKSKH